MSNDKNKFKILCSSMGEAGDRDQDGAEMNSDIVNGFGFFP